jgi:hypothetical protein
MYNYNQKKNITCYTILINTVVNSETNAPNSDLTYSKDKKTYDKQKKNLDDKDKKNLDEK